MFQRIDSDQYEMALKEAFDRHIGANGKGFFDSNPEEASEVDPITGQPLTLTPEQMADNEDDLI